MPGNGVRGRVADSALTSRWWWTPPDTCVVGRSSCRLSATYMAALVTFQVSGGLRMGGAAGEVARVELGEGGVEVVELEGVLRCDGRCCRC